MPRILISEKIDPLCPKLFEEAGFQVDLLPDLSPESLMEMIGQYDGLVVRSATKVTADLLARAARLKVVGRAGAGVDTIDVEAATRAKILVMNTPGQNANGVAELVLGLMLALTRHIVTGCQGIKAGLWEKNKLAGTELLNKTIGVVGFGAIGRRVGFITKALGMDVLAYDPLLTENQIRAGGAKPLELNDLMAQSDFVTLHLPQTPQTRHMICRESLNIIKPGAYLINCARGGLVCQEDLVEALKEGRLAGAAMDVFETEPPAADNPLLALENFICTPHIGASTAESQVNVAMAVARQMIAYFQSGSLEGAVNQP